MPQPDGIIASRINADTGLHDEGGTLTEYFLAEFPREAATTAWHPRAPVGNPARTFANRSSDDARTQPAPRRPHRRPVAQRRRARGAGPAPHRAGRRPPDHRARGTSDWGLAKRKAARQLLLPESAPYPSNAEVEGAMAEFQALFGGEAHVPVAARAAAAGAGMDATPGSLGTTAGGRRRGGLGGRAQRCANRTRGRRPEGGRDAAGGTWRRQQHLDRFGSSATSSIRTSLCAPAQPAATPPTSRGDQASRRRIQRAPARAAPAARPRARRRRTARGNSTSACSISSFDGSGADSGSISAAPPCAWRAPVGQPVLGDQPGRGLRDAGRARPQPSARDRPRMRGCAVPAAARHQKSWSRMSLPGCPGAGAPGCRRGPAAGIRRRSTRSAPPSSRKPDVGVDLHGDDAVRHRQLGRRACPSAPSACTRSRSAAPPRAGLAAPSVRGWSKPIQATRDQRGVVAAEPGVDDSLVVPVLPARSVRPSDSARVAVP